MMDFNVAKCNIIAITKKKKDDNPHLQHGRYFIGTH